MAVVWIWYGWDLSLNIFFATWIESVTIMILETFSLLYAWLILHLMTKSSASVLVMKVAWWTILIKGWSHMWTCDTDVAMSFLMLASVITIAVCGEEDECNVIPFSCWKHVLSFFSLLTKLKENWSEKMSTILEPRLRSGEKDGKIPNSLLFELIR